MTSVIEVRFKGNRREYFTWPSPDSSPPRIDTPVIVDASENQLVDGQIQNFLVGFYPIIRDFPQWLQMLLDRSPEMGKSFFTDNIRVERRHDAI